MAVITLNKDLSEMNDEFKAVADGTYEATIEKMDFGKSSKGNDMLKVQWKIDDGGMVFDNVPLSVDFKVKQYAKLIGMDSGDTLDTDLFLGVKGIIEVVTRNYKGADGEPKSSPNIKRISAV